MRAPYKYELVADDVTVWSGNFPPTQAQIDRAAKAACANGWNGTTLDLSRNHEWQRFEYPSDDVFAAAL